MKRRILDIALTVIVAWLLSLPFVYLVWKGLHTL